MERISRNEIDLERAAEGVDREAGVLMSILESSVTRSEALRVLLSSARNYAGYLSATSLAISPLYEALKTGTAAARASFALASQSGQVEVNLGPERVLLPATGPTSFTHPGTWRIGWWMSHIVGDQASIDLLAAIPIEVMRNSSSRVAECQYLFVEALQAVERRYDAWGTRLQLAIEATDPERFNLLDTDFTLNVLVPEMELLFQFAMGNQDEFQKALKFALERHKKYWSKPKFKYDPHGYLALGPLAIASMAHKAGFAIEVESDYIPRQLIEGHFGN